MFDINYQGLLYAILEIVIMIVVGQIFKQRQTISQETSEEINNLVFGFLFPINIMMGFYQVNLKKYLSLDFLLYNLLTMSFHIVLVLVLVGILFRNKEERVVVANASYRGNFIIMSTPILTALYGEKALPLIGVLVAISQFFYNFYSVSLYESLSEKKDIKILEQVKDILTNPLLIGVFLGVLLYISNINLFFFEGPLKTLGSLASPLALLNLGYSLDFNIDFKYLKDFVITVLIKLFILPLTAMFIARFFNLTEIQRIVAVVLYGAPTAVNSFVFAKKYKVKEELAGYLVLVTTIAYSFSIFIILRLL